MAEWMDRILADPGVLLDGATWQRFLDSPAWESLIGGITGPAGLVLLVSFAGVFAAGVFLGRSLSRGGNSPSSRPEGLEETKSPTRSAEPPGDAPHNALRAVLAEQGLPEPALNERLRAFGAILPPLRDSLNALSAAVPETAPLTDDAGAALDRGDFADAVRLLDEACRQLTEESRLLVNATGKRLAAVRTAAIAGDLEMTQRHYGPATRFFARAIDCLPPTDTDRHLAALLTKQATAAFRAGNRRSAAALFGRAVQATIGANGGSHPAVAKALNRQATARLALGDLSQAESLYLRALAIHQETLGEDHAEVATDLNNLAQLMRKNGNTEAAELLSRRAQDIRQKTASRTVAR